MRLFRVGAILGIGVVSCGRSRAGTHNGLSATILDELAVLVVDSAIPRDEATPPLCPRFQGLDARLSGVEGAKVLKDILA